MKKTLYKTLAFLVLITSSYTWAEVAPKAKSVVDVAKTYAAFWNTGKEEFAREALAKDFKDLNLPQGRKQGIEGVLAASKWFRNVVPDLQASVEDVIVEDNKVVLRLKFTGHFTGKFHNTQGKGQKIDFAAVDMYTIKDNKIIYNWHLEDNQALMTQLNNLQANSSFKLTSTDVENNGKIDPKHYWNNFGCTGDNARPELIWSGVPKDAKSFAITFYDKDAPTGSGFWHWVAYDIPVNTTKLDATSLPKGTIEANTDMDKPGFFAPCPPSGRTHTYTFTLHALDVEKLELPKGASGAVSRFYIENHSIDRTTLSVTAGPRK